MNTTQFRTSTPRSLSFITLIPRSLLAVLFLLGAGATGCSSPQVPSITGSGAFHDIGQIRKGQSPNEVRNTMGTNYKNVMEDGIRGMDGGNYTWVYPEGKVYFGYDGVTHVEPSN